MNSPANDSIVLPTVRQAWDALLDQYRLRVELKDLAQATVTVYTRLRATLGVLADVRIDQLTKPAVFRWHRAFGQVRSIRTGKVRCAQGNSARHVLGLVCDLAELMGWRATNTNPVRGVPRFTIRPRERYLAAHECQSFARALRQVEHDRVSRFYGTPFRQLCAYSPTRLIWGLYLSGQRTFALASLRIADVHLDSARPTMRLRIKGKGWRTYPVAPELAAFFREQIARVGGSSPWMFPSASSRAGHVGGIYHVWERVREAAGIALYDADGAKLVPHGLRHTAACQLLLHGVDRDDVAAFLDDDTKVLNDHYDHVQITPRHRGVVDAGTRILAQLAAGRPVDDGYRPPTEEAA